MVEKNVLLIYSKKFRIKSFFLLIFRKYFKYEMLNIPRNVLKYFYLNQIKKNLSEVK